MPRRLLLSCAPALILIACTTSGEEPLRVAIAANFAVPGRELCDGFRSSGAATVHCSFGATGSLTAQIRSGAPFHIFLAADADSPGSLIDSGHARAETHFHYATGRLALWTPRPGVAVGDGRVLHSAALRRVALANERLAPYGRAARQTLEHLGLWAQLQPKLVRGQSVGQALLFARSGGADVAFVALAQVRRMGNPAGSTWLVPAGYHDPIDQHGVLLKEHPHAVAFIELLRSAAVKKKLRALGYRVP